MKKFLLYSLAILLSGLCFTACDDDDDSDDMMDHSVNIKIEEPIDGSTISDPADVHIHIDITSTDEIHEVEVELHPEGNSDDKIIDFEAHSHEQSYTFEQKVDLSSYASGTCFHLEVKVCEDHDCSTRETADAEFCLE